MKIHRGPQSTGQARLTDEKKASELEREWEPGAVMFFDGTIDKVGVRHTNIGIEIEEADIASLGRAFFKHHVAERRKMVDELTKAKEDVLRQREAFVKILNLSHKITDAPSEQAFADTLRAIVAHYDWVRDHESGRPPDLKWIEWTAI